MMATEKDPLVGVAEVAAHLGLSKDAVYMKVAKGEIPHYRIGTTLRFRISEIEAMTARTPTPTGE